MRIMWVPAAAQKTGLQNTLWTFENAQRIPHSDTLNRTQVHETWSFWTEQGFREALVEEKKPSTSTISSTGDRVYLNSITHLRVRTFCHLTKWLWSLQPSRWSQRIPDYNWKQKSSLQVRSQEKKIDWNTCVYQPAQPHGNYVTHLKIKILSSITVNCWASIIDVEEPD